MWLCTYIYIYIYLPSQTHLNQISMCHYVVCHSFFTWLISLNTLTIMACWYVCTGMCTNYQCYRWNQEVLLFMCAIHEVISYVLVSQLCMLHHTSTASVRVDVAHAQTMISIPLLNLDSLSRDPNYDLSCSVWIASVHTQTMASLSPQVRYCQNKIMTLQLLNQAFVTT
jgi:hypothetical protein